MNTGFHIGFLQIGWLDLLDILLVSVVLYKLLQALRGSLAYQLALTFAFVYLFYLGVKLAGLELLTTITGKVIDISAIALVVVFHKELRQFFLRVGKAASSLRFSLLKGFTQEDLTNKKVNLQAINDSVKLLSQTKTGALIAIAKTSDIRFFAETGEQLDALVSKRLLLSIFQKNSPLHDGAVIIASGRVKAAKCHLPIYDDSEIPAHYGLRHHAAVSLTEAIDAVVVVVSEQSGNISIAHSGKLETNVQVADFRSLLIKYLNEDPEEQNEGALTPEHQTL